MALLGVTEVYRVKGKRFFYVVYKRDTGNKWAVYKQGPSGKYVGKPAYFDNYTAAQQTADARAKDEGFV